MKRQTINIGKFEYIIEMYNAKTDYFPVKYNEYVILRDISLEGNIVIDNDIYFIEKTIYNDIIKTDSLVTDKIAYPCHNTNFGSFSKSIQDFSNLLNKDTLKLDTDGGNVFTLYKFNKDTKTYTNENIFIECDKIKIYHPHNKTDLDYIIYLDNTINGIHFHYFCDLREHCDYNADKQFVINNTIYSEYVELYIPNINALFKESSIKYDEDNNVIEDDNIYINDFFNNVKYLDVDQQTYENYVQSKKRKSTWISINNNNIHNIISDSHFKHYNYVPLWLMLNPFITLENNGVEEKIYFKLTTQDVNNYNSLPINITLYPYKISTVDNIYLYNDEYPSNSDVFTKDFMFKLRSYVGFKYNQLCIISEFDFYNKKTDNNQLGLRVEEAYAMYNGLTLVKTENNEETYKEYQLWNAYKHSIDDYEYNDDDEFESESFINLCGYQIDVATDFEYKNIIATNYIESKIIGDFSFPLLHLFDDWRELPNILVIRVKFIDKYLGIIIEASNIILNKEFIKYTINDLGITRLYTDFTKKQNDLTKMGWNTIDANNTTFNFIDKLNCIVDKRSETDNMKNFVNGGVKIVYKPIFYKAQDLQNISFIAGMKQKIGINLSEFMTKVSIFKLIIDGIEFAEYGRNDIYTIFEVDVNLINGTSGIYNIVDSGDVYISSGTWYKK